MTIAMTVMLIAAAPGQPRATEPPRMIVTQMIIRQTTVIRVPTRPPAPDVQHMTEWRESKGPKCIPMAAVGAAAVVAEGSVDLLLRGGQRVRARFEEDCPDLDYYGGFYIRPGDDGQVCADRDSVRARSGGECRIARFRRLEPAQPKARGNGVLDRIRRRLGR